MCISLFCEKMFACDTRQHCRLVIPNYGLDFVVCLIVSAKLGFLSSEFIIRMFIISRFIVLFDNVVFSRISSWVITIQEDLSQDAAILDPLHVHRCSEPHVIGISDVKGLNYSYDCFLYF